MMRSRLDSFAPAMQLGCENVRTLRLKVLKKAPRPKMLHLIDSANIFRETSRIPRGFLVYIHVSYHFKIIIMYLISPLSD